MDKTEYLKLRKPQPTDPADIMEINRNFDDIDVWAEQTDQSIQYINDRLSSRMVFGLSGSQSIPTGSDTNVVFGTLSSHMASQRSSFAELTSSGKIKILEDGIYVFFSTFSFAPPPVSVGILYIYAYGANQTVSCTQNAQQYLNIGHIRAIAKNTELEIVARQTSGNALNLVSCSFNIAKLGDSI